MHFWVWLGLQQKLHFMSEVGCARIYFYAIWFKHLFTCILTVKYFLLNRNVILNVIEFTSTNRSWIINVRYKCREKFAIIFLPRMQYLFLHLRYCFKPFHVLLIFHTSKKHLYVNIYVCVDKIYNRKLRYFKK